MKKWWDSLGQKLSNNQHDSIAKKLKVRIRFQSNSTLAAFPMSLDYICIYFSHTEKNNGVPLFKKVSILNQWKLL